MGKHAKPKVPGLNFKKEVKKYGRLYYVYEDQYVKGIDKYFRVYLPNDLLNLKEFKSIYRCQEYRDLFKATLKGLKSKDMQNNPKERVSMFMARVVLNEMLVGIFNDIISGKTYYGPNKKLMFRIVPIKQEQRNRHSVTGLYYCPQVFFENDKKVMERGYCALGIKHYRQMQRMINERKVEYYMPISEALKLKRAMNV